MVDLFSNILRPVGLASSDEYDDRNTSEDALERAAKSKFPSKTPEAAALAHQNFDTPRFIQLCQGAAALTLLLRLKRYLRLMYNLSETRCLEFDPNEKEKVGEKGINKSEAKLSFNASVMGGENADCLIRRYAEFRHLMREESLVLSPGEGSDLDDDPGNPTPSSQNLPFEIAGPNSRKRRISPTA